MESDPIICMSLFPDACSLPNGLVYQQGFIDEKEEARLLAGIRALDLRQAKYKEYTAKRRVASFGAGYDFDANELTPAPEMAPFLHPLREKVAVLTGIAAEEFGYALVAEYRPGTQLGWHRDVPQFEEPRSAYVLKDDVRWKWQHSIAPTNALRYSITFRTRAKEAKR